MYYKGDGERTSDRVNNWLEETPKQAPFDGLASGKTAEGGSESAIVDETMYGEPKGRAHL